LSLVTSVATRFRNCLKKEDAQVFPNVQFCIGGFIHRAGMPGSTAGRDACRYNAAVTGARMAGTLKAV
jgi:hypothetical protein